MLVYGLIKSNQNGGVMSLTVCKNCSEHIYTTDSVCPHCGSPRTRGLQPNTRRTTMALLLGFALVGCGDKDEDTAVDTADPVPEDVDQPLYGVPESENTDED